MRAMPWRRAEPEKKRSTGAGGSGSSGSSGVRPKGLLIERTAGIATLAGGLRRGATQADAGVVSGDVAIACWDGHILALGPEPEVVGEIANAGLAPSTFARLDAGGGFVTPGLVDAHTHLLFAGTREREWRMRTAGAGYLEILAAGGGILSTVAATRAATDEGLLAGARARLARMLANGTTTAEAKSGYALNVEGELRTLALVARLSAEGPIELVPTFLGAHAVPGEFRQGRATAAATAAYVDAVVDEQLPAVAEQGIARFCDVFCEKGVFSAEQSGRILRAAASLGLATRLHADELAPSGGAELAAELATELPETTRARSADHLAAPSEEGIAALAGAAEAGRPVVATLLPATSWFLGKHHFAPARRFVDAGVPVALASDLNPGTSPTLGLPLVMSIGCLEMGLTPAEALAAVTVNAAHSLGLGDTIGSIEPGKQADLVVWEASTLDQLPYWLGGSLVRTVVKRGRIAFDRAA
jgi:imidazolonepropionase